MSLCGSRPSALVSLVVLYMLCFIRFDDDDDDGHRDDRDDDDNDDDDGWSLL